MSEQSAERAKMQIAKWLRLIFTLLTTACFVCGVFGAILHWYLLPMFWLVGTGPFACLLHIGQWIEENKV